MKKTSIQKQLADIIVDPNLTESFILDNSKLPGPRANIELAIAIANELLPHIAKSPWKQHLLDWSEIDPSVAPSNHPKEFLPFVATIALATAYTSSNEDDRHLIDRVLRRSANDPRWRSREACAMGLQSIGMQSPDDMLSILKRWLTEPSTYELRAVLAGLAHPPFLSNESIVTYAFESSRTAVESWLALTDKKPKQWVSRGTQSYGAIGVVDEGGSSDALVALRKTLEYAPSVFVAADPQRGFGMLADWLDCYGASVARIVASNLRKARLARHFPRETEDIGLRLEAAASSDGLW